MPNIPDYDLVSEIVLYLKEFAPYRASISAIVQDKIFADYAPQGSAWPYIVLQLTATEAIGDLSGASGFEFAMVKATIFTAGDSTTATKLTFLVKNLVGFRGWLRKLWVDNITLEGQSRATDPEIDAGGVPILYTALDLKVGHHIPTQV